jgi:uncharacterized membrane protein YfcA
VSEPTPPFRQYFLSRLGVNQTFIIACCVMLYFVAKMPWETLVGVFLFLQIASLFGAWWGHRLARKLDRSTKL